MFKIEYEIKMNEDGRPYVELPSDYENNPEDRFFAIEVSRYILQDVMSRKSSEIDSKVVKKIDELINFFTQISDEIAIIIIDMMKNSGDLSIILDAPYNIKVKTINERDLLPNKNILFENKLFNRFQGLKVFVEDENLTYILKDGITNQNWNIL